MTIESPTTVILAIMAGTFFGFASIPHCAGMCGPLHLSVCLSGAKRSFRSLTLFNVGRIAGYTVIGALCGLFGSQITHLFPSPQPTPVAAETSTPSAKPSPIAVPKSCCPQPAKQGEKPTTIAVPKSCCPLEPKPDVKPKTLDVPKSCCSQESKPDEKPKTLAVPKSCCPAGVNALPPTTTSSQSSVAATAPPPSPKLLLPPLGRRVLMFLFPALILAVVGIKGLVKKPAGVGTGSSGLISRLFTRLKGGGPLACGAAASLLPCGLLYVAFGIAVSTLSPILGGIMLFFYCVTITFFLQLGIMVGTTFGKKLGPTVNTLFPYIALVAAACYVVLFARSM